MPLQYLRVDFDKTGATYAPGETVTGRVSFQLPETKIIKASGEIRLEAGGKAKVHWQETRKVKDKDGREHDETVYHESRRYYSSISIRLVGSKNGQRPTTLAAGQHSYPFTFRLPPNIPCSFEHTYGYIRYAAKAIYDRPWRFDHKVTSTFKVEAPLNAQQGRRPIRDEIEHEFHHFCCFSAGVMKINISSGASRFVPGETIELIINFDASSTSVDITGMQLKLVKKFTFYASSDTKYDSEVLKRVYRSGYFDKAGETSLKLTLPWISPSNLKHCEIIDVRYQLALTINVSGMHSKISRTYAVNL